MTTKTNLQHHAAKHGDEKRPVLDRNGRIVPHESSGKKRFDCKSLKNSTVAAEKLHRCTTQPQKVALIRAVQPALGHPK
jgi:hypothetical protein